MEWLERTFSSISDLKNFRIQIIRSPSTSPNNLHSSHHPLQNHLSLDATPDIKLEIHERITLKPIYLKFSKYWKKIESHVHRAARAIIEQRLKPNDCYFQKTELEYEIKFINRTPTAAENIAHAIQDDLERLLVNPLSKSSPLYGSCGTTIKTAYRMNAHHEAPLFFKAGTHLNLSKARSLHYPQIWDENGLACLPKPINFPWQPLCQPVERRIFGFASVPEFTAPTGQRYKEYDLVPEASAELYLQLDQELQNSVINFLAKAPRHLIAVCTVHYKTLKEDSVRKQYLEGFAKRSVEELSHRLWIEIVGAPTVLIDYEIQPIMSELEEISSHIILRTSLEKPSTANISQFGFQGISVDVEALQGISANAFKSKMRTWCSEANKKTLRTIVRGIENPEWFCMTRESGISCIMSAHLLELLDG